jgi:hypothetical protein
VPAYQEISITYETIIHRKLHQPKPNIPQKNLPEKKERKRELQKAT